MEKLKVKEVKMVFDQKTYFFKIEKDADHIELHCCIERHLFNF
jgi:hypothetical protein